MSKKCPKCKSNNPNEANYCGKCGESLYTDDKYKVYSDKYVSGLRQSILGLSAELARYSADGNNRTQAQRQPQSQPQYHPNTNGTTRDNKYALRLISSGNQKLLIVKMVKEATQVGLKEAKEIVDYCGLSSPPFLENLTFSKATLIKKKFEDAGATVRIIQSVR